MSWYALATYSRDGERAAGLFTDGKVYDLPAAFRAVHGEAGSDPSWLGSIDEILRKWPTCAGELPALAEAVRDLPEVADGRDRLLVPFRPGRIFAAAANYIEHANEMGTTLAAKAESNPYIFMKADSSVIGPGETVRIPPESSMVDWEVELAAVIGRPARRVALGDALDHVCGYTVINDITARDLNKRSDFPFTFDWFQGKSFDTFAPLGPWVVPAGLIGDPQKLRLSLTVNGERMQDATTEEMIFTVAEQIAYLSTIVTLRAGDVIATGTPTGVGMGRGVFLKDGDVMVAAVEGIGELENPVASDE